MRPNLAIVVAAFVLGCVILLALILTEKAAGEHLDPATTTDTTPATTWLETQPHLGDGFDELLAGVARARAAHRPKRVAPTRAGLFKAALGQASTAGGYPCGGDLPPCWVLERESLMAEDPPRVWNGNCYMPPGSLGQCGRSTASGLWQFLRSTWNGFGGYVNAADAPVEVQNAKARQLWAGGRGCSHWAAC